LVDTNCNFLEKVMNYESQKCIIVAFHPRNAPIFNPGLLLWVPQTQSKCGDHVLHTTERFPRFSSFIFLCDLLIGAKAGRHLKKVEKHWSTAWYQRQESGSKLHSCNN